KFLLAPDGSVVNRFRPRTEPDAPEVIAAIESVVAK
ncbi:glutathione peroxidase, partial [Mycolicibacterium diernhoferi]